MLGEIAALEERLDAVERRLSQTFRIGIVRKCLPEIGAVRVVMPDNDCLESFRLPILVRKTHMDKDYWMPDVDEQVLCVFLPIGQEVGFVLGSPWSVPDAPPVGDQNKRHIRFLDGTWLEYDRGSGEMQVHCRGTLTIAAAGGVVFRTPRVLMPEPTIIGTGMPELKPIFPPKDDLPCP